MGSRRTLAGLLVDPVEGAFPGVMTIEDGRVTAVERNDDAPAEPLVFPGFVDLHVYEPGPLLASGVTGFLLATRRAEHGVGGTCLGLHLEGPFLNPKAAGAIPVDEIRPVDLDLLAESVADRRVRVVTIAPEIPDGLAAIELAREKVVVGIGHTRANAATIRAAVELGARFATHLWNATAPVRARATGPVPELLLDPRVTVGLIADGRHLHPRIEELTVRVAGPERIALTSDLVLLPAHGPDGRLLGGDRAGAALVARMARFGLAEAAHMASLTPTRLLGLGDRGRIAPGFRADLALLSGEFAPLETIVGGETAWSVRYPPGEDVGRPTA